MYVLKRDGRKEAVRFDKVTARIQKLAYGLSEHVDPFLVAQKVIEGIYDGVTTTELDNLERVEILRGPQSAQFGRNTYVGAVNYVTREPARNLEGRVSATAAQHDSYDVSGWVSGPLGGERLRFAHADVSGFSLFEEAQYRGVLAAERTLRRLGVRFRSSLG